MTRTTPAEETRTLVRSMLATYRLRDTGRLTERNMKATDAGLVGKWDRLQTVLDAGGYEFLDSNPRLAASYFRLERRHLLGEQVAR